MDNPIPEEPLQEEPNFSGESGAPENSQEEEIEYEAFEQTADEVPSRKQGDLDFTILNGVQTVISIALVMATLLTLWNPRKVFNTPSLASLVEAEATQAAIEAAAKSEQGTHIAILAGHWDDSNPGEVCADGLIEADLNHDMALRVADKLEKLGYSVDLFPEYDLNYLNYEGLAFIALYSGSCAESPLPASGFKLGGSFSAANPEQVDQLATCLSQTYQEATSLPFTYEVISAEHASYHIFRDIHATTPAVRLEMGSMNTDRRVLVGQADATAQGIANGILCFLSNQGGDVP